MQAFICTQCGDATHYQNMEENMYYLNNASNNAVVTYYNDIKESQNAVVTVYDTDGAFDLPASNVTLTTDGDTRYVQYLDVTATYDRATYREDTYTVEYNLYNGEDVVVSLWHYREV